MSVKCVTVGFYREAASIATQIREKKNSLLKTDAEKIPQKIKALRSSQAERDKLKTCYGVWFVTHRNNIFYAACTDEAYPERHAFGLLQKIRNKIDGKQNENGFQKSVKKAVEEVTEAYSDIRKVDKVRKAQDEVELLEGELNLGVKKLLSNRETLTNLDDKASQMKYFAKEFNQKAKKVESDMCWQKWKIYIIIGIIITFVIAVVVITVLVKTNKK